MRGGAVAFVFVMILPALVAAMQGAPRAEGGCWKGEGALRAEDGPRLLWTPESPAQGDVLRLQVQARGGARVGRGTLGGEPLRFVPSPDAPGIWSALAGIDAEQEPGPRDVLVWVEPPGEGPEVLLEARVPVRGREFGKEELTLPESKVRLSAVSAERVRRESETIAALWPGASPERLWEGAFVLPLTGEPGSPFGLRRWINGEPRSFHTGMDIKAPRGAPVLASNRGRVCLVGDFFFGGRSVFLDHGLGLYTMYFHLSEILVDTGRVVEKGEVLGLVGSTGRATGPHLHWGVRLGGARVDPEALMRATLGP